MFIADVPGMIIWLISTLVKIAVIILIAVLIIKGIKYLKSKEERDTQRDYRSAQNTIDEIERELNDRK